MNYIIGIDVGGTNTDVVIIDQNEKIIYFKKQLTSPKASDGILDLLLELFKTYNPKDIIRIVLGTTSPLNNIIERKNLEAVGLIRIAKNSEDSIPPCFNWPDDIKKKILKKYNSIKGGFECDGREIYPLDIKEVKKCIESFHKQDTKKIVINSPFSHLFNEHEKQIIEIAKKYYREEDIDASYNFYDLGIIERENTLLLNSALKESFFL